MPALREALASLGLRDVATYIQSGNAVFRSDARPDVIVRDVERRILEAFSLDVAVVLRTGAELERIAGANPFLGKADDLTRLYVVFLGGEPTAEAAATLDPGRSPPEAFTLSGSEIYLHLPSGAGRSKLTVDYFERRLGVRATMRNWNTVLRLADLTR